MDYQQEIIQLYIQNELALNNLYSAYAKSFPEMKDFWEHIAKEERGHAYWIEEFSKKNGDGKVYFDKDRFNTMALKRFYEYVVKQETKAGSGDLDIVNTLAIVLDIEKALLERKFFEIFEADSIEIKRLLNKLGRATEEHIKRVERKLEEEKQKAQEV